MCAFTCTSDAECDDNAHCDLGMCTLDLPDGNACDETSDCASAHCQNGYCCATGDCCAGASNCPFGAYGEPSNCDSPSTCQGRRRDPMCTPSFQCALGPYADDDSGCAGLLANSCGLYPSVFCTSSMSQPTSPSAMCAMTCGTEADCDVGAQCMGGMCRPRGMAGDACGSSGECTSGLSCVDGVCCTSSCTGSCEACNIPGSLGTCSAVPDNQDPANECGGLSCAAYYAGYTGSSCHRRADAPASAVSCNGARSCQGAATVCPAQGPGAVANTCNATCQTPAAGTCTGTTAGSCNNNAPGSQSCGVGACRVTTAVCSGGSPVTCTPGTPSPEVCDDIDNNCIGGIDEGLSGDAYETNNNCAQSRFIGTLGTTSGTYPTTMTINPTLYGSGDVDVFQVNWEETDSSCACSFPSTDEDYRITLTLNVPPGAGSYRVCAQMWRDGDSPSCGSGWSCSGAIAAGSSGTLAVTADGGCTPFGSDNSTAYIMVEGVGAPAMECRTYGLTATLSTYCS